jgi:hypothetical protein
VLLPVKAELELPHAEETKPLEASVVDDHKSAESPAEPD